jgi:hypothetical protein
VDHPCVGAVRCSLQTDLDHWTVNRANQRNEKEELHVTENRNKTENMYKTENEKQIARQE